MNKPTELLPCPFCAGAMEAGDDHGWFTHAETNLNCPITYETFPPCDTEAWNTRALTTDTTGDLRENDGSAI
jgi:hypothetical protein